MIISIGLHRNYDSYMTSHLSASINKDNKGISIKSSFHLVICLLITCLKVKRKQSFLMFIGVLHSVLKVKLN